MPDQHSRRDVTRPLHEDPGLRFASRSQDDRSDLSRILQECFGGLYLWHARRILRGPCTVIAAEMDRGPVGLAMMKMLSRGVAYVYYVAVSPAEQGKGIGGLLLDQSLDAFSREGARAVLASVTRGNLPSARLLVSRGFRAVRFRQLAARFGTTAALSFWVQMTVAPGERVFLRITEGPIGAA